MFIVSSVHSEITRHAKKQENVFYNQEKNQSIATARNGRDDRINR